MKANEKEKEHLTIEQQIELLKCRNLKINNVSKTKWYLERYNYQLIINGYNDPFIKSFDRRKNLYDYDSSFESIIELFDYDRMISDIILSEIQNIERTLSHKIAYIISEEMFTYKQKNGKIFKIDDKLFKILFKEKIPFNEFKSEITKYVNKINDNLFIKYHSNIEDIPIWTLSLSWTFGNLIFIFRNLNKNLQKKIINSYGNLSWNIDQFTKIMIVLNRIRNRTAHNNVLYNVSIKLNNKMKSFFEINEDLRINFSSNSLRLF
ncbi:MAG: Abi family protein, partial [Ureaplasma sp.]|nr:Abi family protein [Ureaplasma sp.]